MYIMYSVNVYSQFLMGNKASLLGKMASWLNTLLCDSYAI